MNPTIMSAVERLLYLNQQCDYLQAEKFAQQALHQFPQQPQLLMLSAFTKYHLNDLPAAMLMIQSAFTHGEQSAYAHYVLGLIYEAQPMMLWR